MEKEERDNEVEQLLLDAQVDLLHPLSVCAMWDELPAYEWQANIMRNLFVRGSREIMSTPNEAGKTSWLVSNAGLVAMTMFPGCQVVSTAGVFRQVSQQLWPEVKTKVNRYPDWKINEEKCVAPSINGLPPSTWYIFATDDPLKAEGYHGRLYTDKDGNKVYAPLLYIIDEAKGVSTGIFEAMFRCDPDFVLIVSTPGEETGEYYNTIDRYEQNEANGIPQADAGINWRYTKVLWKDCPHLLEGSKKASRDQLIKQYGVKNPFIQSMVFGNFSKTGGFQIFNTTNVKIAMTHNIPLIRSDRRAAVDLAGGGDEVVFTYRIGNTEKQMECRVEADTAETVIWLENLFLQHKLKPNQIILDEGGLGKPIIDSLERRGWMGLVRYNFDDKPDDPTMFLTKGMEDHWHLSNLINEGVISILDDTLTFKQMRLRKFDMPNSNGGVMALESKKKLRKRGEESPDRLDSKIMLFSDFMFDFTMGVSGYATREQLFSDRTLEFEIENSDEHSVYGMRMEE